MLPAAGILLKERLYIGIKINALNDESYSEYSNSDDGSININIVDGRNQGFFIKCNGVVVNSSNGVGITFDGFNQGIYPLTVFDTAYKVSNSCILTIGYNGTGSYITYNGNYYTAGQTFHFLNHH